MKCPIGVDASNWKWNGPTNDKPYHQTWAKVSKYPRYIRKFYQWFCGLKGHEISATEWGYGGGNVDCWCRWCNKFGSLKPETARFLWESFNVWGRFQEFGEE